MLILENKLHWRNIRKWNNFKVGGYLSLNICRRIRWHCISSLNSLTLAIVTDSSSRKTPMGQSTKLQCWTLALSDGVRHNWTGSGRATGPQYDVGWGRFGGLRGMARRRHCYGSKKSSILRIGWCISSPRGTRWTARSVALWVSSRLQGSGILRIFMFDLEENL